MNAFNLMKSVVSSVVLVCRRYKKVEHNKFFFKSKTQSPSSKQVGTCCELKMWMYHSVDWLFILGRLVGQLVWLVNGSFIYQLIGWSVN